MSGDCGNSESEEVVFGNKIIGIANRQRSWQFMFPVPVLAKRFRSFPKHPDRLWGPTRLLFIEYRPSFPRIKRPVVMFTCHLHPVRRWRMSVSMSQIPYTVHFTFNIHNETSCDLKVRWIMLKFFFQRQFVPSDFSCSKNFVTLRKLLL
jgi:hypothetical protein